MKLRDEIHRLVDTLDDRDLAHLHDFVQALRKLKQPDESRNTVLTIEEIQTLTASSTGNWSDDVSAGREDRV